MVTSPEFQAGALGTVQGLTEFLPVSSSAHLVIIPWLLHWTDPGLAFDVVLHLGTLVALLIYYWREWIMMGSSLFNGDRQNRRLLMLLIVASIPGAIIGLALEKQAETVFRSPLLIAITLGLMGLALWFFDWIAPQRRKIDNITIRDALIVGFSQALAIVPGVSRSGATITMARILRLEREDAANFSFLMATPIIAGAGLKESVQLIHNGLNAALAIGFLTSLIFGVVAIAMLIQYVRNHSY
ncbi:MAG TPA: undecaprenyl-diphosphate phosphatase, partial [Candidatus Binataceae bacterium]|nr:undecaprenyl-diphosphate phosphatase [Candidatus Binataceae bacterium]